jgi:hypothetical protein
VPSTGAALTAPEAAAQSQTHSHPYPADTMSGARVARSISRSSVPVGIEVPEITRWYALMPCPRCSQSFTSVTVLVLQPMLSPTGPAGLNYF